MQFYQNHLIRLYLKLTAHASMKCIKLLFFFFFQLHIPRSTDYVIPIWHIGDIHILRIWYFFALRGNETELIGNTLLCFFSIRILLWMINGIITQNYSPIWMLAPKRRRFLDLVFFCSQEEEKKTLNYCYVNIWYVVVFHAQTAWHACQVSMIFIFSIVCIS